MENVSQNKKKKKNENRLKYLSKTFSFKCVNMKVRMGL